MASNKAIATAHYFLALGIRDKKPISNKKIQKLLYYAQAWHLVLDPKHDKLFKDHFEAWIHGPAIPSIYGIFKKYLHNPIDVKPDSQLISTNLTDSEKSLIEGVWRVYGIPYDADYLELLTHNEKPWQEARERVEAYEPSKAVISTESMLKFYGQKEVNTNPA